MTLEQIRARYLELNGDHPMSPEDDAYVRSWMVEVPDSPQLSCDEVLDLMASGHLPLPSYLLSDGTPMVHKDLLAPVARAGSLLSLIHI